MPTQFPEIFAALAAPFEDVEIKERAGAGNERLKYITAATALNRLDNVLGPEMWDDLTEPIAGTPNYRCVLTVRLPDGSSCTKTGIGAPGSAQAKADPGKSAASDAQKRACVKFGIARYLYQDGVPQFVQERTGLLGPAVPLAGKAPGKAPQPPQDNRTRVERLIGHCVKEGILGQALAIAKGLYKAETLGALTDDQALEVWKILKASVTPPAKIEAPAPRPPQARGGAIPLRTENGDPIDFGWPQRAANLYAWTKNLEEVFSTALVRDLDIFARERKYPGKYKDWNDEQVLEGAKHVARAVQELDGYDGQFDERLDDLGALKGRLLDRTATLLRHLGNAEPSRDDLFASIRAQSEGIATEVGGGEVVGDFDTCTNIPLLAAVLNNVDRDIADADQF